MSTETVPTVEITNSKGVNKGLAIVALIATGVFLGNFAWKVADKYVVTRLGI